MATELDLLKSFHEEHDHILSAENEALTNSPIIATSSEIEVIAPLNIVSPVHQHRSSIPSDRDSTITSVIACNSTATDDMLDTVDDCVGCVNQISLQHDFEDTLLDVTLDLQNDFNGTGIPVLSTDGGSKDSVMNDNVHEVRSLFHSIESTSGTVEEEEVRPLQVGPEIDILSWCSGGYRG